MAKKSFILLVLALLTLAVPTAAAAQDTIKIYLQDKLDTANAQAGDTFTGTLAHDVIVNGRVIGRKGDRVNGRVEKAVASGRLKTPAEIHLRLVSVERRSRKNRVEAGDLAIKAGSHKKRNLAMIGGGAAAGAIIGAITGGKKGALIGSAIGAGAGTAGALLTGKKNIVLPPETLLVFEKDSILIGTKELAELQPEPGSREGARTASRTSDREEDSNARRRDEYDEDEEYRSDRERDRDREYDRDRDREHDREHERDREREHEREHDRDRDSRYEDYDGPYPREIEVEVEDRYTYVKIKWDDGEEKYRLRSHDYDRVLVLISDRSGLPPGWLRANLASEGRSGGKQKYKLKHDRGVRDHGKGVGRGKGKGKGKGKKKN